MIVFDTNVVSELMRKHPEKNVVQWIGRQKSGQLYLTSLTVAEILRGLALLPDGRRKVSLQEGFRQFLRNGFQDRILSFTQETAVIYAPIYHARVQAGLRVGELDLLIAAITREHEAKLATRNTKDFEGCGVKLINPWSVER